MDEGCIRGFDKGTGRPRGDALASQKIDSCKPSLCTGAVERVIQAMRARLGRPFCLQDMAHVAETSPFHFCRVFHAVTGVPPCRYFGALRFAEATRLLLTTDRSVTDICFSLGYSSFGTFVRRYTQLAGFSPRRLRRVARQVPQLGPRLRGLPVGSCAPHACGGLSVDVEVPPGFDGPVFVAAFDGAIPQGRPDVCAVRLGAGPVVLERGASAPGQILAVGFPWTEDPLKCLVGGGYLRGGALPFAATQDDGGHLPVALRAARLTDPPLVLAVPVLAAERMTSILSSAPARLAKDAPTNRWTAPGGQEAIP